MALDAVFNGAPSNVPAPSGQPALGLDQVSGALYFSGKGASGWQKTAAGTTTGYSGTFTLASLGTATGSVTVVNGVITAVTPAT